MKKPWLPLVVVVLVSLAPVVRADEDVPSAFGQLIAQIVALVVGEEADLAPDAQSNGAGGPGDQAEIGDLFPPWG